MFLQIHMQTVPSDVILYLIHVYKIKTVNPSELETTQNCDITYWAIFETKN